MLDLIRTGAVRAKCDGVRRREFLQVGTLGLCGWTLADLLRLRAAAAEAGTPVPKKSVVLLFLDGGASQIETFDAKIESPAEYRALFGAIGTTLPGILFGSQLPELAKRADRFSTVRTLTHGDGDHGGATHWMKTGYPWPPEFLGKAPIIPQTAPSIGSVAARHFGPIHPETGVPRYVRVLSNHGGYPGDDAAHLGESHRPFRVAAGTYQTNTMLANMKLRVDPQRLDDRRTLLKELDRLDREIDRSGAMDSVDAFHRQATDVLRGKAAEAFDLTREDEATRRRYGEGLGQELLLARRLCEAGAGFVTLNNGYWDHHGGIVPGLKDLCPPLDRTVSVFLDDVRDRGLEDDILLIVTGEFGRTPRLNGGPGRDHWAPLNCALFAGGGLRRGQVVGESDAKGAYPKTRPVTPLDYMATILHVLGVDPEVQYKDFSGRPRSILEGGAPIAELI